MPSSEVRPELADIFRLHAPAYLHARIAVNGVHSRYLKVIRDVQNCRTPAMGGHLYQCDSCGARRVAYNSCRNRHCPKCQFLAKEDWIDRRKADLLPVPYFHIVFTMPADLRPLAFANQSLIYNILFQAASQTLRDAALNPKNLGARFGAIAVLHTWGQNLAYHPHLHCVVPGGGLHPDNPVWVASRPNFFISVRVLSRLFRGKFLDFLRRAFESGKLVFPGVLSPLATADAFLTFCQSLRRHNWVVYAKPPFGGPDQVVAYLGRYTHRIAISNHRILAMDDKSVTFSWKDYADHNRRKSMTLDALEFIRRFLLHVLPRGFMRIRHFGFLSNRNRKSNLLACRAALGVPVQAPPTAPPNSWQDKLARLTGIDVSVCTHCGKGHMVLSRLICRGESFSDTS